MGWNPFSSDEIITDIEALKKAIEITNNRLNKAKNLPYFREKFPSVHSEFTKAAKKLAHVSEHLGKVEKVHSAAKSYANIKTALKVLDDQYALEFDSDKAARAIGILLVEFGGIVSYLPYPVNNYAQFLISLGGNFAKITRQLVPQTRKGQEDLWKVVPNIRYNQ
jgi:hypothetical protein